MYRNISLKLTTKGNRNEGGVMWWEIKETCEDMGHLAYLPFSDCLDLIMYTFNDKLFPATLNFISGGG